MNDNPFLSECTQGMSGAGQTILNQILGATPENPIHLPIVLPDITISKDTMDEFRNAAIGGTIIIGVAIIAGRALQG